MDKQFIFHMQGMNKHYGQKHVLKDINLSFYPGAKIGIVGENGSGKSTLLKIMAGLDEDFQGHAEITSGHTAGIVLQEPDLDEDLTVRETLESAFAETKEMLAEYEECTAKMAEDISDDEMQEAMDRMGELQDILDASDAWDLDQKVDIASDALCLPEDDRDIDTLSGGELRRVALAKILLEQPSLLLLDEPTNHLDAETVSWLETQLRDYPGTVIVVTHDRYFLDNITKWILELDNGKGIPWEGNYSSWLEQKLSRLSAGEKKNSTRQKAIERELAWIHMSNKNRSELSRSRMNDYEKLIAEESALREGDGTVIQIAPGPVLGERVIDFKGVAKGFDQTLFEDVEFRVPKGSIVGMLGPNGIGKTTMFKMIIGEEKADKGEVTVGESVEFAYVDQGRTSLEDDKHLVEALAGESDEIQLGKRFVPVRQYLSWFGFKGGTQQKTVGSLSGGERNRFHLAKTLKVGGNVLLLDEPTNDLDVNTLRMLEDAILDFAGCVLVISHDRFFLDRVCTHQIVFEGAGKVRWFEGNYHDYEEWRKSEFGDVSKGRRNRYRKIVK